MRHSIISTVVLLSFLSLLEARGLKEEFTWTRLSYVIPENRFGGNRGRSYSYRPPNYGGGYHNQGGSYRPGGGHGGHGGGGWGGGSGIAFPDEDGGVQMPPTQPPPSTTTAAPIQEDDQSADYIYQNNIPMGANRWQDKLFITVARRRNGIPSTLSYVSMSSPERHNVPLIPYPDFQTNQLDDPTAGNERLVSIYRVYIDACDRMWFVDTGLLEIPGSPRRIQRQSIVIIDLKTDKIIRRYNLKSTDAAETTPLADITVDVTKKTCNDAYAYIPDLAGYGMVVYSFKENDSWRVTHNFFYLEPNGGDFSIGGHQFQWNDGIFSIDLSATKPDGSRDVYFHAMAGVNLYRVSNRVLKNRVMATRSYHGGDFEMVGTRHNGSQTSSSEIHPKSGVLFMDMINQNAVGCWNTNNPFDANDVDIVQKDDQKMIYPCDLKIYKDDVIVISNKMPVFSYGSLNYDDVNFIVWMNNVNEAVKGTKCARRGGGGGGGGGGGSYGRY